MAHTEPPPKPERDELKSGLPLWLAVGAATGLYYIFLSLTRAIDADEGYFLYAARLTSEGQVPYRDFFYTQMPLIPYLWGMTLGPLVSVCWIGGRLVAGALAWGAAMVFFALTGRVNRNVRARLVLLALYLTSDFGLEWSVVVKTYVPATLFALLAWWAVPDDDSAGSDASSRFLARYVLSGLCAGLALLSRLTIAPLLPLMFGTIVVRERLAGRPWSRPALAWLIGSLIALAPLILLWRADPFAFRYGAWTYHNLFDPLSTQGALGAKASVAFGRIVLNPHWLFPLILLGISIRGGVGMRPSDWFIRLSFLALVIASLAPSRSFPQYYCMATPWLLLAIAPETTFRLPGALRPPATARAGSIALLAVLSGLLLIQPAISIYRSWPILALHPEMKTSGEVFETRLGHVREVSRRVGELAREGDTMLTWWPGYAVETAMPLIEGLENHFGLRVGRLDSSETAQRLGILTSARIEDRIRNREVDLVVVGLWTGEEDLEGRSHYEALLNDSGYRLRDDIGSTEIYTLLPGTDEPGSAARQIPRGP